MKDKGGKEGEDKEERWSCRGDGKKSGRENENIPEIFVRKIHEGFCSITMQAPLLLLLKPLNEDERAQESVNSSAFFFFSSSKQFLLHRVLTGFRVW